MRELIADLIPRSEDFGPGSHPFSERYLRRNTLMMFNISAYARLLMQDFVANGGKIEIAEIMSVTMTCDHRAVEVRKSRLPQTVVTSARVWAQTVDPEGRSRTRLARRPTP